MYDSTSHMAPGYLFQYHVPPTSAALSISRIWRGSSPACRSLAPALGRPHRWSGLNALGPGQCHALSVQFRCKRRNSSDISNMEQA